MMGCANTREVLCARQPVLEASYLPVRRHRWAPRCTNLFAELVYARRKHEYP